MVGSERMSHRSMDGTGATMRVGAYCRVSTDMSGQRSSLELQIDAYKKLIESREGWELTDIYADDGASGTRTARRPAFLRMIRDCQEGKIDCIITKSISRFARNTVDCLSYVRELKSYGTRIMFEKENIDTGAPFSEMLLTILAAFAQEESRSLSENIKWGFRKRFESGHPKLCRMLGYAAVNGRYCIIPEEADTIRRIFALYETGEWSFAAIARKMESEKRKTATGRIRWDPSGVYAILMNENYIGDVLTQKKYTVDHLTHREVKNRDGVLPQYYIRDHHEPIVERALFERCGQIANLKNNHGRPVQYPYADKLVCPLCGRKLIQRSLSGRPWIRAWHCERGSDACRRFSVKQETLDRAVLDAVENLTAEPGTEEIIALQNHLKTHRRVDYYWLDRFVDCIAFGQGHWVNIHWKNGRKSSAPMQISDFHNDPQLLSAIDRGNRE